MIAHPEPVRQSVGKTMIERRSDWLPRLEAYVNKTRADVFSWGASDCGLWASGAIRAMTGTDPAASFRGTYENKIGAIRRLKAAGFDGFIDFADKTFEAHGGPLLADVGDLVLLEGETLGICQGRFAWALGLRGVVLIPMESARRAWIIPKPRIAGPVLLEGPEE